LPGLCPEQVEKSPGLSIGDLAATGFGAIHMYQSSEPLMTLALIGGWTQVDGTKSFAGWACYGL